MVLLIQTRIFALSQFLKLYEFAKKVKKERKLQIILSVVVIVIGAILLGLREPFIKSFSIDFDPYKVLNVKRTATKREISKAFTKLSRTKHPDLPKNQDNPKALAEFTQISKAYDLLRDKQKRENLDKWGSPEGNPFEFEEEYYPTLILAPGKKFIIYIFILFMIIVSLPFSLFTCIPWVESPPKFIQIYTIEDLNIAEKNLKEQKIEKTEKFLEKSEKKWTNLCNTFPNYQQSQWDIILRFRIISRKIQILLSKKESSQIKKVFILLKNFRKHVKGRESYVRGNVVQKMIQPQILDLEHSIKECHLKVSIERELLELLSNTIRNKKIINIR